MDEQTKKNEQLWNKLARNEVLCSQPKLEMTPEEASAWINRHGLYADNLEGQHVLCLACGGGQQSIAFALLGATVTVVDFSTVQLERDKMAAEKYGKDIRRIKSDMRDLSFLSDETFDIVYQPYSINYVDSVEQVFNEVARITKPAGLYDLMFHNPFVHGSWKDGCWGSEWKQEELWQGKGYPVWQPYKDGYPIKTADPHWNFINSEDEVVRLQSPQEYRHTLSTILNGLTGRGFELLNFREEVSINFDSTPGSWEHYTSCAPPWLYIVCRKKVRT